MDGMGPHPRGKTLTTASLRMTPTEGPIPGEGEENASSKWHFSHLKCHQDLDKPDGNWVIFWKGSKCALLKCRHFRNLYHSWYELIRLALWPRAGWYLTEFPSQAGPPPGTSEQQVPPYLPTLQSPEQDTTHLHTCNGLLSAPPDWGSPLAGAPRPCSIESSPLESKEVFRGCTENLLSVRNGASLLPTSVIQFQRSILIWDEIR